MYLSKTSAYTTNNQSPVHSIPKSSTALPQNSDGLKDSPTHTPVKQMGKVGTIINTMA